MEDAPIPSPAPDPSPRTQRHRRQTTRKVDRKGWRHPAIKPAVTLVAVLLLMIVAYQVYLGGSLKKVGIAGMFNLDFADKSIVLPPTVPDASPEFFYGRWQVEPVVIGNFSDESSTEYEPDGTFQGHETVFVNGVGRKVPKTGRWNFEKLSKDRFRLTTVHNENSITWRGTFRIIDQDHIQNTDQNYVAVRLR
jgi:hypothetical protein